MCSWGRKRLHKYYKNIYAAYKDLGMNSGKIKICYEGNNYGKGGFFEKRG